MSLRVYGLARVVKKSKITVKNNQAYVKLNLSNIDNRKGIIESICFKKVNSINKIQEIKPASIIYIDGKLELDPLRIISSSFDVIEMKSKVIDSNSINKKTIALALKKAQDNININKKINHKTEDSQT